MQKYFRLVITNLRNLKKNMSYITHFNSKNVPKCARFVFL